MNLESVDVTAGLGGFLAFFLLAVALYFLMRNMNTRLRGLSYREEQEGKDSGTKDSGTKDSGTKDSGTKDSGTEGGPEDRPDLGSAKK